MRLGRSWAALLVLVLIVAYGGSAQATGTGFWDFRSHGERGGGPHLDDVYTSGDGTLEFFDFRFRGIDPDDVTIEVGDSDITFSGEESVRYFGFDSFKISYSVRALNDLEIIGTGLSLDSEVDGPLGAVIATKKITAPREKEGGLPWLSLHSFDGEHRDDWKERRGYGPWGRWKGGSEQIGKLVAFNIAAGWVCGCGHHHAQIDDVESECRIEQDMDSIEYDPEETLHIQDTVKLFSIGKGGATWRSLTNSYVVTPEPGTAALLGLGLLGLFATGRRRR